MKVLIFGINGQDGFYLSQLCKEAGAEVIGISRSANAGHRQGNIADFAMVEEIIKKEKPAFIFHLAANSSTRHDCLFENHETISTGTLNVLEAVHRHSLQSKVFLSGSAVQFENNGQPINEQTPFAPLSPYAVARIQSVYAARYFRRLGVKVYVGYFFHHDSPLRGEQHINQKIVQTVQRIVKGSREKLELGNVQVKKEFNFAGDLVAAIWKMMQQEVEFELVIGSGKAYSLQQWVEYCFQKINRDWREYIVMKENFTPDFNVLVSNPQKLFDIGWQPKVNMEQLADMMLLEEKN
jgi:GDPmannose 4,6-dehydratase